jgi:hypothetical protein
MRMGKERVILVEERLQPKRLYERLLRNRGRRKAGTPEQQTFRPFDSRIASLSQPRPARVVAQLP